MQKISADLGLDFDVFKHIFALVATKDPYWHDRDTQLILLYSSLTVNQLITVQGNYCQTWRQT